MTPSEMAARLTGREYGSETTPEDEALAKEHGLVIVFGASDDLLEFRGAIDDELGAWNGRFARVDQKGLTSEFEGIDLHARNAKELLRDYFRREDKGATIHAKWATDGYSWIITTDTPHATFEIVEDGEPFCRGIVFAMADVPE